MYYERMDMFAEVVYMFNDAILNPQKLTTNITHQKVNGRHLRGWKMPVFRTTSQID